jgi:RhtB (resistance to homoserine/threonine) family protein
VNDSSLWLFVVVAAGLTLTPGADTLLVIKNSLRGGRHAGWATTLGISAGLLVHAAVSALGLSTLLAASPGAMAMIQVLGAAYLVVLGVQALRGGSPASDAVTQAKTHSPAETYPWSAGFYEGLLTNLLNPKIIVFYLALLPQFIAPGQPVLATSLGLASIHVAMGALWLGLLAAMLARGRSVVSNPQVQRRLTQACGLMLLGLGVRLLVTAR